MHSIHENIKYVDCSRPERLQYLEYPNVLVSFIAIPFGFLAIAIFQHHQSPSLFQFSLKFRTSNFWLNGRVYSIPVRYPVISFFSMFLVFVVAGSVAAFERRFPFVPIVLFSERYTKKIRNYFDLVHLPRSSPATDRIRGCVRSLKAGVNTSRQMNELQILVDAGNGDACFIMGTIFEYGLFGQEMNDTRAREYFVAGSKRGHSECQASLAFFMRYGLGGSQDIPQSVVLTAAASETSIRARLHSSFAHHFGYHVEKSCHLGYRELEELSGIVASNTSFRRAMGNRGVTRLPAVRLPSAVSNNDETSIELQEIKAKSGGPREKLGTALMLLRQVPPLYDRAVPYLKSAMEELPEAAAIYALLLLNHEISSGAEDQELEAYNMLQGALPRSTTAQTEIGKMLLRSTGESKLKGMSLLGHACNSGSMDACHEIVLGLLKGKDPFEKNVTQATDVLRHVAKTSHFEAIRTTARMIHSGVLQGTCHDALSHIQLYLELSFLFDDAQHAWAAVTERDIPYALRIYQHLADMGSEAAAWNSERLAQHSGLNSTIWFDLQVMHQETALYRLAKQLDSSKDGETIDELLKQAMKVEPAAAFDLAWRQRWTDLDKALTYFQNAVALRRTSALPVALAKFLMFLESIPDILLGRTTAKTRYFLMCMKSSVPLIAFVFLSYCLYTLLGIRVKKSTEIYL